MPPRTGTRRKRRVKQSAPRHFIIIGTDTIDDLVVAHRIELADGNLVLRDQNDAISRIHAAGEWREIRPATIGDIPYADEAGDSDKLDSMQREEATLGPPPAHDAVTRVDEPDRRFVPSSPEEAQRILMELERRTAPDYQDPPDCESNAAPTGSAVAPRKD